MKIIVCVKQVPDTTEVRIDPKTNNLVRAGVPSILNPSDKEVVFPFDVKLGEEVYSFGGNAAQNGGRITAAPVSVCWNKIV